MLATREVLEISYRIAGEETSAPGELSARFDQLRMSLQEQLPPNYCPDCRIPMTISLGEYQCTGCALQVGGAEETRDPEEVSGGSIRIATGVNKGRLYNPTADYAKAQLKAVILQLDKKHREYMNCVDAQIKAQTGPVTTDVRAVRVPFRRDVLAAAAGRYNEIQKFVTESSVDKDGKTVTRKFVRRGNIRDEVLAALIYFEGIRLGVPRQKRDISLMMALPNCGFSSGEDILRTLQAQKLINIAIRDAPAEGYADRYIGALNLTNNQDGVPNKTDRRYVDFVVGLVDISNQYKIGMNSQLSSKIVGAIWILIEALGLDVSYSRLEQVADNTKRNTFNKFAKIVKDHPLAFKCVFEKHGIPMDRLKSK